MVDPLRDRCALMKAEKKFWLTPAIISPARGRRVGVSGPVLSPWRLSSIRSSGERAASGFARAY